MENLDVMNAEKQNMEDSIKAGDTEKFVDSVFNQISKQTADAVTKLHAQLNGEEDEKILASRGIHVLTSEEKKYYTQFKENLKKPQAALTDYEVTIPETITNRIYENMEQTHELLNSVDFVNSNGITEWILSKDLDYASAWGDLNDAVTQEAKASFYKVSFSQYKLSVWMPVPITMVELGLTWLDQYVVRYMSEIMARALEKAIVTGDGQKKPVGMMKEVDVENQATPAVDKTATAITDLSPMTIGEIAAALTDEGKRDISTIDVIVNPVDYWKLVMPAITYTTEDGAWRTSAAPLHIIKSFAVPSGKAIFGLCSRYFAVVGFGVPNGKVQFSDEYKFLEDVRAYKARLVAYGTPMDNTSFLVYDISGLNEAAVPTRSQKTRSTSSTTTSE